jgi:hypothetical protein
MIAGFGVALEAAHAAPVFALLRPFWEICLLRRGPQDLPPSPFLVYLALAAHAVSVVAQSVAIHPFGTALLSGIIDTAVLAVLTYSLLFLGRMPERIPQTLSALAGTGAFIGVLALVPTGWWFFTREGGGDPGGAWLLLLALVVWSLVVMGHVLRQALSTNLFVGLGLAAVFYWFAITVRETLFPVTL